MLIDLIQYVLRLFLVKIIYYYRLFIFMRIKLNIALVRFK